MSLNKNITVAAGLVALVGLSYVGFGVYSKDNTAQAQNEVAQKWTTKKVDLTTDKGKLGYTIGTQIGRELAQGGMAEEVNIDALSAALRDALTGADSRMSDEEMVAAQQAFQLKRQQAFAALAAQNKATGDAFLAKNGSTEGISTTESGLQYEVVREGKGAKPAATDTVRVHYLGSLLDGTPFDSSYARNEPADFPVNQVIPGFSEGLQLMNEGAKFRFVIPSELGYGERAPQSIGPSQVLVFEVELLEILPAKAETGS